MKFLSFILIAASAQLIGEEAQEAQGQEGEESFFFGPSETFEWLPEIQADFKPWENVLQEPAIQGLTLSNTLILKDQPVLLNQYLSPNSEITTQAGIEAFFPDNDGVLVKNSGLYRVSFFQRVYTTNAKKKFVVLLLLAPESTPEKYIKRRRIFFLEPNSSEEIQLSQILRIEAGQKVRLALVPFGEGGDAIFSGEFSFSGLILEKI